MEGTHPAAAVTAVTMTFGTETKIDCGTPQTVKIDCQCCDSDVFAVVGLQHGYGGSVAVESECVECGAVSQRRLPTPGGDGR